MRYTLSWSLPTLTIEIPPASLLPVRRRARAIAVLIVAAIIQPAFTCAQTLNVLFAFPYNANTTSNYPDGANPYAEMIEGPDGQLLHHHGQWRIGCVPWSFSGYSGLRGRSKDHAVWPTERGLQLSLRFVQSNGAGRIESSSGVGART
jgi:hypothetical protein